MYFASTDHWNKFHPLILSPEQQDKDQMPVVNVYSTSVTSDNISRNDLLSWVNDCLQSSLTKIEEMATGAAYCQLTDFLFPTKVPLKKVKWNSRSDVDWVHNWRVLQQSWKTIGIDKPVPVQSLIRAKFQDNFEFLQWFKKFFDANYDGHKYDSLAARNFEEFPAALSNFPCSPLPDEQSEEEEDEFNEKYIAEVSALEESFKELDDYQLQVETIDDWFPPKFPAPSPVPSHPEVPCAFVPCAFPRAVPSRSALRLRALSLPPCRPIPKCPAPSCPAPSPVPPHPEFEGTNKLNSGALLHFIGHQLALNTSNLPAKRLAKIKAVYSTPDRFEPLTPDTQLDHFVAFLPFPPPNRKFCRRHRRQIGATTAGTNRNSANCSSGQTSVKQTNQQQRTIKSTVRANQTDDIIQSEKAIQKLNDLPEKTAECPNFHDSFDPEIDGSYFQKLKTWEIDHKEIWDQALIHAKKVEQKRIDSVETQTNNILEATTKAVKGEEFNRILIEKLVRLIQSTAYSTRAAQDQALVSLRKIENNLKHQRRYLTGQERTAQYLKKTFGLPTEQKAKLNSDSDTATQSSSANL
ncbi:hypothetical protein niasHS_014263 [Heterodera schachtii]|uniref:Calponin-homology (CH) domain-containing protein n=1 Tax=Heterodera schachtii TaxID=97005 RepID=A0ABD2I6R6_HETSC